MPTREEMRSLGQEIVQSYEDRISEIAQIKLDTSAMLRQFDKANAKMGKEMRADLAKGRKDLAQEEKQRQSEAREFLGELAKVVAEGKAATQARLKEFAYEQAGAHDEWLKLGATMQAKRGGSKAKKASPPSLTPEETEE